MLPERIQSKMMPEPNSGCWLWTAAAFVSGYGAVRFDGRTSYAHRVVYEHERGPIPAGLEIDHKCRNRLCVNPDHLEPVTKAENARRALPYSIPAAVAFQAAKTHCHRGHPFSGENLAFDKVGARRCRTCARENMRATRIRQRGAA